MCRKTATSAISATKAKVAKVANNEQQRGPPRLLLSLDSCSSIDEHPPQRPSLMYSGIVIMGGLICSEMFWRWVFASIQHWHPILEVELNRQILARHVGVDCTSLAILVWMGYQSRYIVQDVVDEWWHGKKGAVAKVGYMNRMYMVRPEAIRICTFFLWYQIKNSYDSLVWHDGPEYVFHHVMSLITVWTCFGPFFAHYYAVFFLSLCEVSTCVLCLLANFDDHHGVPGMGDAFPMAKVILGGLFVVLFIICRCILWPIFAYNFYSDTRMALKANDPQTTPFRRSWMIVLTATLVGLSFLQILWLGQIFIIAKQELIALGLI